VIKTIPFKTLKKNQQRVRIFEATHFAAPATSNAVIVDLGARVRTGSVSPISQEVVLGTEESVRWRWWEGVGILEAT